MKNTNTYRLLVIAPFAIILAASFIQNQYWVLLLLVYALIYRPVIDYYRLKATASIKTKDIWKLFVPFYRVKYFKELY